MAKNAKLIETPMTKEGMCGGPPKGYRPSKGPDKTKDFGYSRNTSASGVPEKQTENVPVGKDSSFNPGYATDDGVNRK